MKKIAIVHDYLNQYGGAERVLDIFLDIFKNSDLFTLIHDKKSFSRYKVTASFLQKIPFSCKYYRNFLPLFPLAIKSLNLNSYDIILSSSHAWAKGIKKPKNSLHICYCYTPMRYAWDLYEEYKARDYINPLYKLLLPLVINPIKAWDIKTSNSVISPPTKAVR